MPCKSHPRAPAGWSCVWCKEELCPDCVARRLSVTAQHDVCTRCGGPAQPLRRLRSDTPYLSRLGDAWKYPLQGNGRWAIGSAAVVFWLLNAINAGRWAAAILWAYVFSLIRANANGKKEIEAPDFSDIGNDLVMPAVRGALATAIVWLPSVLYLEYGRAEPLSSEPAGPQLSAQFAGQVSADDQFRAIFGEQGRGDGAAPGEALDPEYDGPTAEGWGDQAQADDGVAAGAAKGLERTEATGHGEPSPHESYKPPPPLHRDPIFLLLLLFGVLYAPMALLVAATGGGLWQMLNPVYVVAYALRIPRDYGIAVGASAVLAVAYLVVGAIAGVVAALPVPVIAGIAGAALSTYVPFVTARVLGLLLWIHGATLGCLPPDEAWEPLLPGVEPRGTPPEVERPPVHEAAPAYEPPTAIALDGSPAPAYQRPAAIELDEAAGPPPPAYQRPAAIELDEPELPPDAPPGAAFLAGAAVAATGYGAGRAAFLELPQEPAPAIDPAAALAQAVAQSDFERAVELYRRLPSLPATALPSAGHFGVGRTAAFKGGYVLAVRALKASIAAGPTEADTPRAYVMLARIHAEKLNDPATAEKVYRFVVHRYPGTEAAKFAQARLAPAAEA